MQWFDVYITMNNIFKVKFENNELTQQINTCPNSTITMNNIFKVKFENNELTQQINTCPNSTIEALKRGVKYVQS